MKEKYKNQQFLPEKFKFVISVGFLLSISCTWRSCHIQIVWRSVFWLPWVRGSWPGFREQLGVGGISWHGSKQNLDSSPPSQNHHKQKTLSQGHDTVHAFKYLPQFAPECSTFDWFLPPVLSEEPRGNIFGSICLSTSVTVRGFKPLFSNCLFASVL